MLHTREGCHCWINLRGEGWIKKKKGFTQECSISLVLPAQQPTLRCCSYLPADEEDTSEKTLLMTHAISVS